MTGIYRIRNIVNNKCYIGSSADFHNRERKHFSDLRSGRHHSSILQRAYNKYGEKAFVFEPIEHVDKDDLLIREQYYLTTFKPQYNVSFLANEKTRLGLKSSDEHKARMSRALKGRVSPMLGKKFSEEHRRNISKANKGKKNALGYRHTEETKEKIRLKHNREQSNGLKSPEWKKQHSIIMRDVYHALPDEKKRTRGLNISKAKRTPDLITNCVICKIEISYRPNGKEVPKTCCALCRSKHSRNLLDLRRRANPNMDKDAANRRWGKL